MKSCAAVLVLIFAVGPAAAFEVEPELYGAYHFFLSNVEYDTPPAPRPDERSYLLQRLEVGARWIFADWASLEAGLEVEHDCSDALEFDTGNWDNFRLNPRLRLKADFGGWGVVRLGHLDPDLGSETLHTEPYDHPAAGLGWWGEEPGLSWSIFGVRTGRVTEGTAEVFLAGCSIASRLDLGPLGITPRLVFAYRHAGGYDTADYQGYEPPDGVRKAVLLNLGGGLDLCLPERALYLGGGYFVSRNSGGGGGALVDFFLGGAFGWLDLRTTLYLGDGYRGVRPMSALEPVSVAKEGDTGELKLLDVTLGLSIPLPYGAVGRIEVRQ
ncbi:MAG: hypothetical protein NTW26_00670, partial [bacterium]|nr:hypothetical protein [bacterium]